MFGVSDSCFCVIAQGAKHVMLGEDRFRYDPQSYLINTLGLPTVTQIDVPSPNEPYLGLVLVLNPAVVTSIMVESGMLQRQNDSCVKAIAVSALDRDLLNACVRLVRLLESPEQYRLIGPLVIREIICRSLRQRLRCFQLACLEQEGTPFAPFLRHLFILAADSSRPSVHARMWSRSQSPAIHRSPRKKVF
jgi:hypothetical protein